MTLCERCGTNPATVGELCRRCVTIADLVDPEDEAIARGETWPGRTCGPGCAYCGACT